MTSNGQPQPLPGAAPAPSGGPPAPSGGPAAPAVKPRKSTREFWRAMRFVHPYRRTIAVSVVCAVFVGLAVSGSLTAITPVLHVLLKNQTVHRWVDARVVESRLGVRLLEDAPDQLARVERDKQAAAAGLAAGDRLKLPAAATGPAGDTGGAEATIAALADPAASSLALVRERGADVAPLVLPLPPVKPHLLALRRAAAHVSPDPVWAIAQIFGALALVALFGNTLKFFQEYLSDTVAVTAVNDVRRKVYDHLLHVPMSHFGRHGTSDVTSRLVQDSMALEVGFKTVLGQSIQQPIIAGMAFAVALYTSWQLTLVIVVFAPVMAVVIQKFGKKMRRAARGAMQKNASMLGQLEGTLTGIRAVKAAGAERWERRRYRGIMRGLVAEQLRMSRLEALGSPIMETITTLVVGVIVLIATYMVTKTHTLDVVDFFTVMASLGIIGDSMRRLNKVNGVLQRANAGAQRIFEVLALPVEKRRELLKAGEGARGGVGEGEQGRNGYGNGDGRRDRVGTEKHQGPRTNDQGLHGRLRKLPPLAREVRFEHVTFAYPGALSPALSDVSLSVPKGTCVAVVGRNGSGKTTLLALLPRFYDVTGGRVTVDGVDVRDATLRSLRGQISLVTQDSIIFPGTIAENIAYGHPLAGRLRGGAGGSPRGGDAPEVRALRQQIESAARRAFAHEFILEKPAGYDTILDGLGGQLSGGQRQRLCIARAILRNAPILILDEATSQVDAESEHLIQQAVDSLMHAGHEQSSGNAATGGPTATGPTIFVIAHRFSTILSADVIVVMERGRIVGQGKHEELLRTCEVYQQLYERQLIAAPAA